MSKASLLCRIYLCRIFGHNWKGCTCKRCGRIRDENHDWQGCKCAICGWSRNEQHNWRGCKCTVCGRTRDEQHKWKYFNCQECKEEQPIKHLCKKYSFVCKWEKELFPIQRKCYRICEYCGCDGTSDHQFVVYEGKCYKQCSQCGYKESLEHKWVHQDGCSEKCANCGAEQESHEYHLISHEVSYGTGRCYHVDSSDEIYCLMCKTPNACLQYPQSDIYTYRCLHCGKISVEYGERSTTGGSGNSYVNDLPEANAKQNS